VVSNTILEQVEKTLLKRTNVASKLKIFSKPIHDPIENDNSWYHEIILSSSRAWEKENFNFRNVWKNYDNFKEKETYDGGPNGFSWRMTLVDEEDYHTKNLVILIFNL